MVHAPALGPQKGRNPAVAVPAILAGHPRYPPHELRLIIRNARLATLGVPSLTQHPTSPAFGCHIAAERVTHVLNRLAPLRRAQKFPEAAFRRIASSS